ncbi:hypothetical protein SVAN01_06779 [Stagonosporopsis vannaccii]|nr:hypothetical protein SVAN01_06779 [Stagonosporopsis vannaccii]
MDKGNKKTGLSGKEATNFKSNGWLPGCSLHPYQSSLPRKMTIAFAPSNRPTAVVSGTDTTRTRSQRPVRSHASAADKCTPDLETPDRPSAGLMYRRVLVGKPLGALLLLLLLLLGSGLLARVRTTSRRCQSIAGGIFIALLAKPSCTTPHCTAETPVKITAVRTPMSMRHYGEGKSHGDMACASAGTKAQHDGEGRLGGGGSSSASQPTLTRGLLRLDCARACTGGELARVGDAPCSLLEAARLGKWCACLDVSSALIRRWALQAGDDGAFWTCKGMGGSGIDPALGLILHLMMKLVLCTYEDAVKDDAQYYLSELRLVFAPATSEGANGLAKGPPVPVIGEDQYPHTRIGGTPRERSHGGMLGSSSYYLRISVCFCVWNSDMAFGGVGGWATRVVPARVTLCDDARRSMRSRAA